MDKLYKIYGLEKCITTNTRRFMAGHFPDNLIYPGVLLLDILQRSIIQKLFEETNKLYFTAFIKSANFKKVLKQSESINLEFNVCKNGKDYLIDAIIFSSNDEVMDSKLLLKEVRYD